MLTLTLEAMTSKSGPCSVKALVETQCTHIYDHNGSEHIHGRELYRCWPGFHSGRSKCRSILHFAARKWLQCSPMNQPPGRVVHWSILYQRDYERTIMSTHHDHISTVDVPARRPLDACQEYLLKQRVDSTMIDQNLLRETGLAPFYSSWVFSRRE